MSDAFNTPPPADMGGGGMAMGGTPAEFGPRLVAYIIDILIGIPLFIPGFFLFIVGSAIGGGFGGLIVALAFLVYLLTFFAWLYILFMGMAVDGQTPGKRMQGIKVTKDSGEPIGLGGAVVRWLVAGLSNTIACGLPLGSLFMLMDSDKKTIYDKVLNNKAIAVEKGSLMPLFPGGKPF